MKVSMQEFKSHLAQYVRETRSGKMLELTLHRKVVARVIGVPQAESAGLSRLLADGSASWQGGKTVSAMVLEDRG